MFDGEGQDVPVFPQLCPKRQQYSISKDGTRAVDLPPNRTLELTHMEAFTALSSPKTWTAWPMGIKPLYAYLCV